MNHWYVKQAPQKNKKNMILLQELHPAQKKTTNFQTNPFAAFTGYVDLSDWACVGRIVAPKEPVFDHLKVSVE